MSSPKVIRDIKDRLKLSGGTLTGSLFINNGYAYAAGNADESIFLSRRNFNDEKYSRYISISAKENIAIDNSITFIERNNDVWKTYKLYGEHNKPTAADIGALSLTGGTVTGNITVQVGTIPCLTLKAGTSKTELFKNANVDGSIIDGTHLRDFPNSNNGSTFDTLLLNGSKSLDQSLVLARTKDGNASWYKIYGEHNKPAAKDVQALAWCPNEDVNTSPSILAVVNSMNTGGSFFAVQGSSIINASDSPSPGAEFHYFVLMDTQSRKRVIAHHYNDGGFNIFTRRVFSGSWLDGAWVNLGAAFSNADTVDGYHGWEFARTALTTTNDLNYLTFSGMYRINGGSGANINAPSGIDWGQVLVVRGGGDTIAQVGFDFGGSRAWLRTGNPPECNGAGAWRPWYQFYTTGNIQKGSSSVPGDLQEDGIYIKY